MDIAGKLVVLNLISKEKDILFGKLNGHLTNEMKIQKWMEITQELQRLGIYNKDWKYLRDTTWQNWRKRTVEKCVTGPGQKKWKYDKSDEIILNIITKNGTVSDGLDKCPNESTGYKKLRNENLGEEMLNMVKKNSRVLDVSEATIVQDSLEVDIDVPLEDSPKSFCSTDLQSKKTYGKKPYVKFSSLRKEKLEAEVLLAKEKVEIAKREKYKLDLELIKLEKELHMQKASSFTLPYYQRCDKCQTTHIAGVANATGPAPHGDWSL